MKKVLYIAPHRANRAPSQRFRFEQYIDFLKENGYDYTFSNLLSAQQDKMFYGDGNTIKKFLLLLQKFFYRLNDVIKARNYDLVFIQREAYFLGPAFFEFLLSKIKTPLIFDFDDSIWLPNVSNANKKFNILKNYGKTAKIIKYADMIFAGNAYLANYAGNYNKNIKIIPTTIDTDEYVNIFDKKDKNKVVIGWSGSITTIQHFEYALPFLREIKNKYGDKVEIKVIGDGSYINNELNIKGLPWIKEDEIKELSSMDIGIMPLPNNEWASGKCGLKGIQYMALQIPTIMSPVGVNTEIIEDGVNGFLCTKDAEWEQRISQLIESPELRKQIGEKGRRTIVERYSVQSQKLRYLKYFDELTS